MLAKILDATANYLVPEGETRLINNERISIYDFYL